MANPGSETSSATLTTGDIQVGAVEIKNGTDDTRMDVITAGADAASNTANSARTSARLQGFNGTTWDRIRTAVVTPTATLTGFLNSLGWAVFNTTPTTRTNGQGGPIEADSVGNVRVTEQTLHAGEDLTNDVQKIETRGSFLNITTNTTTTVKTGAGVFYGFTINNNGFTTAGTVTIYDNTAGSGTKIGTWTIPIQPPGTTVLATTFFPPALQLNASFATGLTIVTATTAPAVDMTVIYR